MTLNQSAIHFDVVTSTSRNPVFVTDADSKKIGSFKVNLPFCEFKRTKDVNVKMIFSGTELKVEARDNITNQHDLSFLTNCIYQINYKKCALAR
jgi:hypothetical protein